MNGKIVNDQYGFEEGKSCFSNLLEAVAYVLEMIEAGYLVDFFTQFHITCKAGEIWNHGPSFKYDQRFYV